MQIFFSSSRSYISVIFLCIALLPTTVMALTPIAQPNVVPNQRFSAGEKFNFGVVAFSKAGIDRVKFTISGQGYSGQNPLYSSSMTYNSRTDVYEYWVPLDASKFSSDGPISVSMTVYGKDGGSRNLGSIPLVVNASGKLPRPEAWVSNTGSDSSGKVNNRSNPFRTIGGAISAIQSVNGGVSDGATVYFYKGTYSLSGANTTIKTNNEWLTFKKDTSASIENTIINNGGNAAKTKLLKVDSLTLTSSGKNDYVFNLNDPDFLWVNNCNLRGSDRWAQGSNPVKHFNSYHTNNYIYNVDRGVNGGILARNLSIEHIGEDAFQNFPFAVNIRVKDQDPGNTYWHADGFQQWGDGKENTIVYNYYGTDMHYQGLFMRATNSAARNNAFVNVFMEMRPPGRPGSSGGNAILSNGAMFGPWDHVVFWHNTLPSSAFYIAKDKAGYGFTNSSFIGNVFHEFKDAAQNSGSEPTWSLPGNTQKNEFLFNHITQSYTDLQQGHNCGWPTPAGCPHVHSKSPDSDPNGSQSIGDPLLNLPKLSNGQSAPSNFGQPKDASPLINKITKVTVPADVFGNPRDQKPDIGAFEKATTGAKKLTAACSDSIDNDSDGLTDYPNDPGCTSSTDNDEYNEQATKTANHACNDSIDNDSDGLTDYPNDPGCTSITDNDENNTKVGKSAVIASTAEGSNLPDNTLDGNLNTRWSAEGDGQWIRYDLGEDKKLSGIMIAWYNGDKRVSTFDVQLSINGTDWITVLDKTKSNGKTLDLETHQFGDQTARYVRIVGHMNSVNAWNSITEVGFVLAQLSAPNNLRIK